MILTLPLPVQVKQLECGCPDSTCADGKSCSHPMRRLSVSKSNQTEPVHSISEQSNNCFHLYHNNGGGGASSQSQQQQQLDKRTESNNNQVSSTTPNVLIGPRVRFLLHYQLYLQIRLYSTSLLNTSPPSSTHRCTRSGGPVIN